ncbi:MAG: type II secretion system protein [Candidatus Eremiobacteraeota bacterium]|nr:type II secretion system protein [Candidatus Eremiobacteraeota bacterium]
MRSRGISLVETIVAFTVLSTALLVMLNLFLGSHKAVAHSERMLAADSLARSLLQEQMAVPFEGLELGTVNPPAQTSDGTTYAPEVTIFEVPDSKVELLKGILVRVVWQDAQGQRETVHQVYRANVSP